VPQEYAVSNAPRVSLNPLSYEHQAMRGRGEREDADKLTKLITYTSQKSLVGLALGRDGRGSSSSPEKKEVKRSVLYFARDRERARKGSARPKITWPDSSPTGKQ